MPYVPPELKERIKREVSIQRLAEARGIKLRRSGKELIGLCPFHKDTNPSLNIDPVKNVWDCKGACGEGGDVISWVMRAEGISFTHAVELLKRNYLPSVASAADPPPKISTVPKLPPLFETTVDDQKLLSIVVDYYHATLKQTPGAQQYLLKRGLQSAEMVEHFRLGFSNRSLNYRLQDKNRVEGLRQRGRLEELGVLREKSGHEHFVGSLVIPILNLNGDVVQMYGRKINDNLRPGTEYHLYLPGPRCGVWNEAALIASKEIILCEALIDALTFWCAGYRNVTTSYGVNGFNDYHREAFRKHGTRRVYIAYDRDEAGEKAAEKHAEELIAMGIECFRVQFPRGQDANEFALKNQPAAKFLGMYLTSAAWLGKGQRPTTAVMKPAMPAPEEERKPEPMKNPDDPPAPSEAAPLPEEKPKSAAKEKIASESPTPSPTPSIAGESVLSLAAASESVPREEAAPQEETVQRPMPLAAPAEPRVEIDNGEIVVTIGPRTYRVLNLDKCTSRGKMQVNVKVSGTNVRGEWCYHGDTFDMESSLRRAAFIKQAAHELATKEETIHREVGQLWTALADLQREMLRKALTPGEEKTLMTDEEEAAALELLRDPRLLERVLADFEKCGVVGEETNKRIAYLAAVSRLLEKPLAIVVQSASSAGKSSLMEAVLDFVPEEQRESYTAMTGQALFYMGQKNSSRQNPRHLGTARGRRRVVSAESVSVGRQDKYRFKCQRPGERQAGDARLRGGRSGDGVSHDHVGRGGRGTVKPLHCADGERGPRADAGDPSAAAGSAYHRRPSVAAQAGQTGAAASQRAAPLAPHRGGEQSRRGRVSRHHDARAARPHEAVDADRRHCAVASAPAGDQTHSVR